jgi:hypothetical protein
MQPAPQPPKTENLDEAKAAAGTNEALRRRQRLAISRASTNQGGAMQGPQAGEKTRLGD